jgi:vitellogenic carboxypeptidase-like protein
MLTPYIEAGRMEEAAADAKVQRVMQTEESYSGFLTVNKQYNSSLFFWED